jgi:hypothetical protein
VSAIDWPNLSSYRGSLEAELAQAGSQTALRTPSVLQATVDALIDTLRHFPEVLEAGEVEERKAVVRAFLQVIRIEKTTGQAVYRCDRLPRDDLSIKLVELRGLEPERYATIATEDELLALPASGRQFLTHGRKARLYQWRSATQSRAEESSLGPRVETPSDPLGAASEHST